MPDFLAFLSFTVVAIYTPGPNTLMAMSNASRYGFKKSMHFNFGVFCGFIIIMNLCGLFSLTVYNLVPSIKPVMTVLGAAYILWLAWKIYQSKPQLEGDGEDKKNTSTFLTGLLLQFVNPKLILFGIAAMTTFVIPYYQSVPMLVLFSVLLALLGLVALCCWSLFGSLFQRLYQKNAKLINTVMALLLVYCAVSLFLS